MSQYFTAKGLQKLKDELHCLKTTKNKEIIKLISEAAAFGDLKENAAYHDARDKMSFLRMRVAELEGAINEAVIREKEDSNCVQIGSIVKILFDNEELEYEIVSSTEANILKKKLSYSSPLGKKLMSQKVGKEFDFKGGEETTKVKVLEIK